MTLTRLGILVLCAPLAACSGSSSALTPQALPAPKVAPIPAPPLGSAAPARVIVVGGGLAGLVTAYELEKRGITSHLLEANEEIDAQYAAEPIDVGFNAKYLLDALAVMKAETLEFKFKDRLSPAILQESGHQNYTYVIMPMRI